MDPGLQLVLAAYLFIIILAHGLDYLNFKHLKRCGLIIPPEFSGQIDPNMLTRTRDYVIEKTRFGFISSLFGQAVLILFLFGGLLNWYNARIAAFNIHFIPAGLLFFVGLSYAQTLLSIPFDLYRVFKLENKFGFNNTSIKLWLTDTFKSLVVSTILLGLLIVIGLGLVKLFPGAWWLCVWGFFLIFSLFIMYISPYVLEPLFNKFTPLEESGLSQEIRDLMQKAGIKLSRIFKIDASKRSKHTNAYFTGIGKVKRIVLYDTLIEKMEKNEILAVLAHEVGHWKKKHLLKMIVFSEILALLLSYVAFRILETGFLIKLFQLQNDTFFAKLIILGFLLSLAYFPFQPVFNYFSRKHEHEADRFSRELTGTADGMISALVKLSKDNLSNLHPHPLYAAFHYSHPPVVERIKQLKKTDSPGF
ncbi:M48 family metallopeptidase [bacterium]|nr:M48 family metallopeptidase [bacterium]